MMPMMTDCWVDDRATNAGGYVPREIDGKFYYTHRLVYEALVAPIPDGLQIDHLCRNRACYNPLHLEPVTQRENILRGASFAAVNAEKTHCPHGHPFDEENTYTRPGANWRECRTCRSRRKDAS